MYESEKPTDYFRRFFLLPSPPPSKGLNSEMVLWFQICPKLLWEKCSSDREKLLIFEAEGQEFAKILRSLARTIYLNKERSEEFLKQSAFLICSWRFLRSNTLEQLYIDNSNWKNNWDWKICSKSWKENIMIYHGSLYKRKILQSNQKAFKDDTILISGIRRLKKFRISRPTFIRK